MKTDFGHSIELDAIDASSEPVSAAPPVVMVQYRDHGVPLWILIPLIIIVPMCAIVVYHRLVVVNYRRQAEARLALDRQIDAGQTVVSQAIEIKTSEPLARNSQPIVGGSMPADPAPGAGPTGPSLPTPKAPTPPVVVDSPPAPIGPPVATAPQGSDSVALNSRAGQPSVVVSSVPAAGPPSTPTMDQKPGTTDNKSSAPAQSNVANPNVSSEKSEKPAAPTEVTAENGSVKATGSLEDSQGATAIKPAESAAEPADGFPGDAAAVKAEPLPTKEETLRQIAAEAAKKQAELNQFEDNKQAEFHTIRENERVKFRDELREVLQTFGAGSGPEIDKLAKRYGYDVDRERVIRAYNYWKLSTKPLAEKVRMTRALELPETVILDFLSAEIDKQKNSREGPSGRNAVRIRAAKMLLNFELHAATAPVGRLPTGRPNPGAGPIRTPQRGPAGIGAGQRSQ